MVTGFPFVRTLKVPVLAPGPPPIVAGLIKVMLDEVKLSFPRTERVPVIDAAWAARVLPTAKTVSAARRFSIGGLQVKRFCNVREYFSHYRQVRHRPSF
jgi:hypothetical protein